MGRYCRVSSSAAREPFAASSRRRRRKREPVAAGEPPVAAGRAARWTWSPSRGRGPGTASSASRCPSSPCPRCVGICKQGSLERECNESLSRFGKIFQFASCPLAETGKLSRVHDCENDPLQSILADWNLGDRGCIAYCKICRRPPLFDAQNVCRRNFRPSDRPLAPGSIIACYVPRVGVI